jgi:hypothetical protein
MLSGLASSFMWGIGMGAGSEVGHQAVRGLMGGSKDLLIKENKTKYLTSQ